MNPKKILLLGAVFGSLLLAVNSAQAQGTAITYQGRLYDGGVPANGTYDLTFSLFKVSAGGSAGAGPLTNSPVTISNGLFTVTLDFGAGVFDGTQFWLQIGTRTNGGGAFTDLAPRQELTPAPYAIYAATAPIVDNSVTSAKIQDNTITSTDILNGTIGSLDLGANSVNSGHIIDGQVLNTDLANDAVNSAKVLDGSLVGTDLANNTVGSDQLADTIALGRSNLLGRLDVFYSAFNSNQPSITLFGSGSQISTYGSDGLEQIRLWGGSYGEILLKDSSTNNRTAVILSANGTSGGLLQLSQADGNVGLTADGDSSGSGLLQLRSTNGATRVSIYGKSPDSGGGEISVADDSGDEVVEIKGNTYGGQLTIKDETGARNTAFVGSSASGGGFEYLYKADGSVGIYMDGESGGGALEYLYTADGSVGIALDGESGGAGYLAVYNTNSSTRVALDGYSTGGGGRVSVYDDSGTETVQIIGAESATSGGQILMRNAAGANTIQLDSDASGVGCGYMQFYKSNGVATITINADTAGDGRITTQELQITGGSDLSEQFDINSVSDALQPGMVVCIDPHNPGELVSSTKAYDRTVAGVISGAGGVKPGMLMGQAGTKADGKHPVALTGRVYVLADASKGAIFPGDLLTTSSTPGHAMKVTNHNKANGAMIGKAMTELKAGKGLVLVLVSLQ